MLKFIFHKSYFAWAFIFFFFLSCSHNPANLGLFYGLVLLSPKVGSPCKPGTSDFPADNRLVQSVELNFLGTF